MLIKKYLDFISESTNLGQWIESLSDDPQIGRIVNRYITDETGIYGGDSIGPEINLSNAINLLPEKTKAEIEEQVNKYLEGGLEEKDPDILVSTDTEELMESVEVTKAGRGIFQSFLKSLTALGQKESQPNWENTPNEFLLYYKFINLDAQVVKSIFSRFKSLTRYLELIDYSKNEVGLYFGVLTSGDFEYGILYDIRVPIGHFKLSASVVKWITSLESKSAQSLKREIVNMTYNDIINLGLIKNDMTQYNPGYFEKRLEPQIKEGVISFGFYGIGKWDNGKLDEGEYQNIKLNFTNWLMTKKWGSKVLISVKSQSFWLYFHIKLK
jgi:hypothetical protein